MNSYQMLVSLGLLILGGCFSAHGRDAHRTEVPPDQKPVAVSFEELEGHRTEQPVTLHTGTRLEGIVYMAGIRVKVTVSPDGAVTSTHATMDYAPSDLKEQAEAAVSKLHYTPFQREGHAVWATFNEYVRVLPPELKPTTHIPFPEVRDGSSMIITLTRTTCLGTCPFYRVEIHGDGEVLYEGKAYVAIEGEHRGTIPQEKVRELVGLFRQADYYSLQDEYRWPATDLPTYISSIKIDGQSKTVTDYAGLVIGMPLAVHELEASIERISEVKKWTAGNADTVHVLRNEKWDFQSAEAAKALASVAHYGTVDAVRDFVRAGVRLDGKDAMGGSPLTEAARRGNVEMLRILLEAGASKGDARGVAAALAGAAQTGKAEAMEVLLKAGARDGFGEMEGKTILMLAAASGVPKVVAEVLKSHPAIDARDKEGKTALMEAVGQYHYDAEGPDVNRAVVVQLLLEAGADPNARDEYGNTALIKAGWDADAVLALLEGGAKINAQNKEGLTALMNCGSPAVAKVLLAHWADPSIRDSDGETALDFARKHGMKEKEAVLLGRKEP